MVAVPAALDEIATENAPVSLSLGTVTLAGTEATAVLLLDSATTGSVAGVGPEKNSVADENVLPVWTRSGVRVSASRVRAPIDTGAGVAEGAGVGIGVGVGVGVGVDTVQPDRRATVAVAEPSLTSTVQSAGGTKPDRSILKLPVLLLVVIATPSTVMDRLAVGVPLTRSRPALASARVTVTAACADTARVRTYTTTSAHTDTIRRPRLRMTPPRRPRTRCSTHLEHDAIGRWS